jgi:hypothetical protein
MAAEISSLVVIVFLVLAISIYRGVRSWLIPAFGQRPFVSSGRTLRLAASCRGQLLRSD